MTPDHSAKATPSPAEGVEALDFALKCPICGGTERSLLPSSVCEECGCDMKPDTSEARRVLFDKSQPKEARMAAMNVLQPKLAATPAPANPHIGSSFDDFLREEGIAPAEACEPVVLIRNWRWWAAIIPMVALLAVCGTAFVLRVLAREIAAAEHKCFYALNRWVKAGATP